MPAVLGAAAISERPSKIIPVILLWNTAENGRIIIKFDRNGKRTDINGRTGIQHRLQAEYLENGKCLPLTLEFDYPTDYFAVVSYYAGDC